MLRGRQFLTLFKRNYKVLGFGSEYHGALASGLVGNTISREMPTLVEYFKHVNVVDVSCGWGHSTFTVKSGDVYEIYVAGRTHDLINTMKFHRYNDFMTKVWLLVGFGNSVDYPLPTKILETKTLPKVYSGAALTFIIADNKVISFGYNRYGQCAVITEKNYQYKLESPAFEEDVKINSVSLGFQHTHLISDCGKIFSSGKGNNGQLGTLAIIDSSLSYVGNSGNFFFVPEKINPDYFLNETVKQAVSCLHSSSILTDTGKVFTFGKFISKTMNEKRTNFIDELIPREIDFFSKNEIIVKKLYSGTHYYLAETDNPRRIFIWGFVSNKINIESLRKKILLLNPKYKFSTNDDISNHQQGSSRMFHEPIEIELYLNDEDKIFPSFDGFYVLRSDGKQVSYFDWNFELEEVKIKLDDYKIKSIKTSWKHSLLLVE